MSVLKSLIGKTVARIRFESGYYLVDFEDGSRMHIFNFVGNADCAEGDRPTITSVHEDSEVVELRLDNGKVIGISLRDQDYVGPEAFHYIDPGKGIFIVEQ